VSDAVPAAFEYVGLGHAGGTPAVAAYDDRVGSDINAFKILEGRRADPNRADEAVVGFQVAEDNDLQLGDPVPIVPPEIVELVEANDRARLAEMFGAPVAQEEFDALRRFLAAVPGGEARVVGIVAAPGEVPPQYQGVFCCVHLTPAFARLAPWENEALVVRLRDGAADVPAFLDELERSATDCGHRSSTSGIRCPESSAPSTHRSWRCGCSPHWWPSPVRSSCFSCWLAWSHSSRPRTQHSPPSG
jgi:hypothetical protein